jgi:hypothetical protein
LENRDNSVYRSIFEAQPIPDSARVEDIETKREVKLVQSMGETELTKKYDNSTKPFIVKIGLPNKKL